MYLKKNQIFKKYKQVLLYYDKKTEFTGILIIA